MATIDLAAETALYDDEAWHRAILDALHEGVVLQDAAGQIIAANPAAERTLGLTADQLYGRTSFDPRWGATREDGAPLPGDEHPAIVALRTGEPQVDVTIGIQKADGPLAWLLATAQPLIAPGALAPHAVVTSFVDITPRREAEVALSVSEARYRALVEHSRDAIFLTDGDGHILAANPAASSHFGYGEAELCRLGRAGLVDPSDPRVAALRDAPPDTTLVEVELRHRRQDGSVFPAEVTATIFRDRSGRRRGCIVIRDITARKFSEEALQESEERFRSAFAHAAIGMALVGLDGRWLRVNRSLCDLLGYGEAALLATSFQAITHPDDLDLDLRQVERLLAGAILDYQLEKRYRHRDGRYVWALLSVSLVRDERGQPVHFISQIQDIDGRKRAEEALRASEARLQTFLDNASDLIQSVDERGRILYVNRAWEAALGYRAAEARRLTIFDIVAPEEEAHCREALTRLLADQAGGAIETVFVARGGARIEVLGQVNCQVAADGTVWTQGIFRDVTQQKAYERRLIHQASHDALTGLANRRHLNERLSNALARSRREADGTVALLYLDLDGFKGVNDTLGHEAGDYLLGEVADRLRGCIRGEDLVARLGGDEFAILLIGAGAAEATAVAARVVERVAVPIAIGPAVANVSASVGGAVSGAGDSADELLRRADEQLYAAKRGGKNRALLAAN